MMHVLTQRKTNWSQVNTFGVSSAYGNVRRCTQNPGYSKNYQKIIHWIMIMVIMLKIAQGIQCRVPKGNQASYRRTNYGVDYPEQS